MRLWQAAGAVALVCGAILPAQAALIGVNERIFPDTLLNQIDTNYDASTNVFTMTGRTNFIGYYREFDGDTNTHVIRDGTGIGQQATFLLTGKIDETGQIEENLQFEIRGAIPDDSAADDPLHDPDINIPYQTLLKGAIYAFGFAVAGPDNGSSQLILYEMVGTLSYAQADLAYQQGQTVAMIWQDFLFPSVSGDAARFQSNFFTDPGSGGASADLFVVPVPGSAWLMMLAAGALWRRRRAAAQATN